MGVNVNFTQASGIGFHHVFEFGMRHEFGFELGFGGIECVGVVTQ